MGRRPISERPQHIEARSQIGHWECDMVIGGAHKQAIVTLVERKSGYALIAKVSNKNLDPVSQAIITQLNPVTPLVKTLTFDNGKEFTEHRQIDTALQSKTYFAVQAFYQKVDGDGGIILLLNMLSKQVE